MLFVLKEMPTSVSEHKEKQSYCQEYHRKVAFDH